MLEPFTYPLSEPGPYNVGKLTLEFEDPSREDRPVEIRVWYTADGNHDPDLSGAPYPLILSSEKWEMNWHCIWSPTVLYGQA